MNALKRPSVTTAIVIGRGRAAGPQSRRVALIDSVQRAVLLHPNAPGHAHPAFAHVFRITDCASGWHQAWWKSPIVGRTFHAQCPCIPHAHYLEEMVPDAVHSADAET